MSQNFVNPQFSKDLRNLTSKVRFEKQTLMNLAEAGIDSEILKLLKKVKKHSHRAAINRQTVDVDTLVKNNMLLAVSQANHYFEITGAKRLCKCSIDDVIQAGNLGLIIAARKYIETKNGKYSEHGFSHYAKLWVKKYVTEFITTQNPVKASIGDVMSGKLSDCKFISVDASYDTGESDMIAPIFNELVAHMSIDEITTLRDNLIRREQLMNTLLATLSEQEKQVIDMSFGLSNGLALEIKEIASKLHKQKRHIQALYDSAIFVLKTTATQNEFLELIELAELKYTTREFATAFSDLVECPWKPFKQIANVQNLDLHKALTDIIDPNLTSLLINKTTKSIDTHIAKNSQTETLNIDFETQILKSTKVQKELA